MTSTLALKSMLLKCRALLGHRPPSFFVMAIAIALSGGSNRMIAQDTAPPPKVIGGYVIHQTIDLGGHIAETSGSGAVYDTIVNLQTGPRILSHSLDIRAVNATHTFWFDHLSSSSFGYGGDPNNVTVLNISKGRFYDFSGTFRRDRQYFDYNLLDNPLIPPASSPYVPVLDSPHLFNTVRRMTDLNLTLAPLSKVKVHFGYSRNISEGPSYSTIHVGAEALLVQNWRNSTDSWSAALDWKPDLKSTVTYNQVFTYFKGDTNWQLTGLNYRLSDGTPVSTGIDLSSVWKTPCATPFNPDGTVNPTCNAFLGYRRSAPTRTLFPTEQLLFQSASIPSITINGRFLYSGTTSNLNNFNELFNGLDSRVAQREVLVTGSARARRIDVNGDFSATWQVTPEITATDTFSFWDFRMPGTNTFTETDYAGTSLLTPPGASTTTTTPDFQFINQKTKSNTFLIAWDVTARAGVSAGYRYRSRIITDAGGDFIPIHENWGLFGAALRPTSRLRINFNMEAMYADNAFTRISPRQLQHYIVRATYRPHPWLTVSGTTDLFESRDNVQTVNHLEHSRDFSLGASVVPGERWSLDVNYAYDDIYSSTIECYTASPALPSAGTAPAVCAAAGTPLLSNGYYNAPTQFASIGFTLSPLKRIHAAAGYRVSAVNGSADFVNVRQVNGALQSQFHTPYANLAFDLERQWTWHAEYNYDGYGEGGPVGPTLPRNFHANICTLGVRYVF